MGGSDEEQGQVGSGADALEDLADDLADRDGGHGMLGQGGGEGHRRRTLPGAPESEPTRDVHRFDFELRSENDEVGSPSELDCTPIVEAE